MKRNFSYLARLFVVAISVFCIFVVNSNAETAKKANPSSAVIRL